MKYHHRDLVRRFGPALLQPATHDWLDRLPDSRAGQLLDQYVSFFLSIRDRRGQLLPFHLNSAQRLYANHRAQRNIILKARQVGMTTYIAARFFLLTMFRAGTTTLQVAHSQESAEQIFRIVRRFLDTLHADLRREVRTGPANVRELAFTEIDSRYLVDTAGNRNVGRGLTIHNLHASEVALWPGNPYETIAGLLAAVAPDGLVDVESTPNGIGGYFHSEWLRAKNADPGAMTPHFFPWWLEPDYCLSAAADSAEPYSDEERALMQRVSLGAGQIQFRRYLRRTFGALAPQEFAETDTDCFLLSGSPVFDTHVIDARLRHVSPAPSITINGALHVWCEPQRGHDYIIGADVAEGRADGDYSAAVVIDARYGLQCAEMMAHWPITRFAQQLDALGRCYNTALLAVERNNHGHAVLQALRQQLNYPRLYRHSNAAASDADYGWPMNAQTKPCVVQILDSMLREAPAVFASARLLEQCRRFGSQSTATAAVRSASLDDHRDDSAAHDDLVIAMAIALAVRARAPSLTLLSAHR